MSRSGVLGGITALTAGAVLTGVLGLMLFVNDDPARAVCEPGSGVSANQQPDGVSVAGWNSNQLAIAATIINAGADLGLSVRDQTIAVMTAMGESSLTNVDHGDAVRNDTIGVFQTGPEHGSRAARMDPYQAAVLFYERLTAVTDRDSLQPTIAAHRAQRNADPYHYEEHWPDATEVVQFLAGEGGQDITPATTRCSQNPAAGPSSESITADGWTKPLTGFTAYTSGFGEVAAIRGGYPHSGIDLSAPFGHPIYAAADGVVIAAGPSTGGNTGFMVAIDHGGGVESRYVHPEADGIHVRVGDQVTAGDHIADVGSSGNSSGPHLHYEIRIDGTPVDPVPFMAERGIDVTAP